MEQADFRAFFFCQGLVLQMWFPKIRGPVLGGLIMRIIIYWGLLLRPPCFWTLPNVGTLAHTYLKVLGVVLQKVFKYLRALIPVATCRMFLFLTTHDLQPRETVLRSSHFLRGTSSPSTPQNGRCLAAFSSRPSR